MEKARYPVFEALNPFFEIVLRGLSGLVNGEHYFDTFGDDAVLESRYHFQGWPVTIRGRVNLMASLSGYGKTMRFHSGDALVVHRTQNSQVVILEYEGHGRFFQVALPMTIDSSRLSQLRTESRTLEGLHGLRSRLDGPEELLMRLTLLAPPEVPLRIMNQKAASSNLSGGTTFFGTGIPFLKGSIQLLNRLT